MKKYWDKFVRSRYSTLFLGIAIGLLLMVPAVSFAVQRGYLSFGNSASSETENSGNKEQNPTSSPNSTTVPTTVPSATPSSPSPVNPSPSPSPEVSTPGGSGNVARTEADVISYFEQQESEVTRLKGSTGDGVLASLKNGFTTVVDFLFYDQPIYGYRFQELTDAAKIKILKIATSIDHKIDQYFPDYKDSIKNGFTTLKGKAVSLYLNATAKLCEAVGSTVCNQAREDFKNMKEYLKIDWNLIKGFVSDGTGAIKEWYESFR